MMDTNTNLNTSLKGRLRNTNLPKANVLFPLFEAVVNSIHAIDERIEKQDNFTMDEGRITIYILRASQLSADDKTRPVISGFKIVDNGIGFNEDNYNSFKTLDSEYKISIGGRGVGRLLWLKAFSKVSIKSIFLDNISNTKQRSFDFNIQQNIHNHDSIDVDSDIETSVTLQGLRKEYEKCLPKTSASIANHLLEHCLWYFLREGGAPHIKIIDADETIPLDNEYSSYMLDSSLTDRFFLKDNLFELTHVKLRSTAQRKHYVVYSAANRVVREESLVGKVPGLFGSLKDNDQSFGYMCFVTSDYLTDNVNPERIGFNIVESKAEIIDFLFEEEISFEEIQNEVTKHVTEYLKDFLEENKKAAFDRVEHFVSTKAPRYRPILPRISQDEIIIDPNISDKDLELKLHSQLVSIESDILSEGHDLMKPNGSDDDDEYYKRLEDYLSKVSDIKQSDLANYVTHRKTIIDLLGRTIQRNKQGKYPKEEVIHQLIMPMKKDSTEMMFEHSNLWLIDERLTFHNYLASDKTITSMPITDSEETKEPDLLGLNIYNNPLLVSENEKIPPATITIVEIKRPMRNDASEGEDKDPIEQALGYLERIRLGKVQTYSGRPIPDSNEIPGFCYIIADITPSLQKRCKMKDLQITADKMGYFGFNKHYNSYIEVISFDRLLNMATERNRAFFDKLGLPTT